MAGVFQAGFDKACGKQQHRLEQRSPFMERSQPLTQAIRENAPTVANTVDEAFYFSLKKLFGGDNPLVLKSLDIDKLKSAYRKRNRRVAMKGSTSAINGLERGAKSGAALTAAVTAVEGAGLGLLGIGLPDIPVALSLVLHSACKIACGYGFDPRTDKERAYILELLGFSASSGEPKARHFAHMNALITSDEPPDLEEIMHRSAKTLADSLCAVKFVQGMPVIGAVGGGFNLWLCNAVQSSANDAYKSRYLADNLVCGDKTGFLDALLGR